MNVSQSVIVSYVLFINIKLVNGCNINECILFVRL